jgi:hypothetical protein
MLLFGLRLHMSIQIYLCASCCLPNPRSLLFYCGPQACTASKAAMRRDLELVRPPGLQHAG